MNQILREKIKSIGEYLGCNEEELVFEMEKLIGTYFISREEVEKAIKKYDESPDDMAGFEIRIKKPVEFRTALGMEKK